MSDTRGFLKYDRQLPERENPHERIRHFGEFEHPVSDDLANEQAARCMDCGVPFCQSGCPLGNVIPEFNDAVYCGDWHEAYRILSATNNFPEFTGRICPAPCEASCVLGIHSLPVTIEHIEKQIAERSFENGWVEVRRPASRSEKTVGIVGSGPAGLAAADELNHAGHTVTVYEKDDRIGGLLRYGIPDFKLEKWIVDRRIDLMREAGVTFVTNMHIGVDIPVVEIHAKHDALLFCGGASVPRDLNVDGRGLGGIHFAMDYLTMNNRRVAGNPISDDMFVSAAGKDVVVIGGGDTGSDCIGTANRQGAKSVTQIELLAKPPTNRHPSTPWPLWPMQLRTSSSHEEGCDRKWAISTKSFIGDDRGQITGIEIVDLDWSDGAGHASPKVRERPDSRRVLKCDLALLAIGFLHGDHRCPEALGVATDARGNIAGDGHSTNVDKVFSAGDMRIGQSLVVTAIAEGRRAAEEIDEFLERM